MRIRWIFIASIAAAVLAGTVSAAGTTDAKSLLLRSSDVPSDAKRVSFGSAKGAIKLPRKVHAQVAYVGYSYRNGSKRELLGNAVGVFSSSNDAHEAFAKLKKEAATDSKGFPTLSVKHFGDEQIARGASTKAYSVALLGVRNGSRVWEVVVSDLPGLSKSGMIAQLDKYAAKAKGRAT
jgi:hypothetical protein